MKQDIRLKWSKKENDLLVVFELGHRHTGQYVLDIFSKKVQEDLSKRGYDLTTLKFSISKKNSNNYKMVDGEYIDEDLIYINKHYNMDLKKGQIVKGLDEKGEVLGGTNYVYLKHGKKISCYHPQDINFLFERAGVKDG